LDFSLGVLIVIHDERFFKTLLRTRNKNHVRFSINLIFGAEPLGVPGTASRSSMADMGGLVAKGDGTAAGNPNVAVEGPLLNPRLGKFAVVGGGGLVAEGVEGVGTVLLLNSAQRGHLRLVFMCPI